MTITSAFRTVVIGSILLLVLVTVLGAIDPDLSAELTNTDVHPNGPLTLAIVALLGVAFTVSLFLAVFDEGSKPEEGRPPFQ